jgi:hypothetical protein
VVLLDIETAYDTLWLNDLPFKLFSLHLPDYLLFFLKSYLEGRTYTVLKDTVSKPKSTPSGLPQGAVLSTTLFPLYLSDMPCPPHTQLTLYADDIALLSQSWRPDTISRKISTAIMNLYKYFTTWELQLNNHKTEAVLFSKSLPPLPGPNQFQDTFGPEASTVRYLGLVLDSKLIFNRHLHTFANKATGVFYNIFPLLARHSALTRSDIQRSHSPTFSAHTVRHSALTQTKKISLYKLLIHSNLIYVAPL